MMMGASLVHPTRKVTGSRFRKGMSGDTSHLSLCLVAFVFTGLGLGLGQECEGLIVALGSCCQLGGGPHSLSCPQAGLKGMLV